MSTHIQVLIAAIKEKSLDIAKLPTNAAAIEGVESALLGMTVHTNVELILSALDAHNLLDGWKHEYSKTDPETEIEFCVRSPNGIGWYWSAFDPDTEEWICADLPGLETKEAAMEAAETWYATWKARFQATGERSFE